MIPVVLTKRAAADVEANLAYVASENPSAANAISLRVEEALHTLSVFPEAGVEIHGRRKFPVPRTSLILIYRVTPQRVQVTRCFDGRENWKTKAFR